MEIYGDNLLGEKNQQYINIKSMQKTICELTETKTRHWKVNFQDFKISTINNIPRFWSCIKINKNEYHKRGPFQPYDQNLILSSPKMFEIHLSFV